MSAQAKFNWDALEDVPAPDSGEGGFDWNRFSEIDSPKKKKHEFRDTVSEELRERGYEPDPEEEFERLAEQGVSEAYKGLFSGASLGASKYILGLKPGENFAAKTGEFAGIALPITGMAKLVDYFPFITKNLPKALQVAEKLARSGMVGAATKGAEQAISGQAPDIESLKSGATFAGLHALLMSLGTGGKALASIMRNLPSKQVKTIENILFEGKPPPRSLYEVRKETLQELQHKPEDALFSEITKSPFGQTSGEGKPLKGRVSEKFDELGLKPIETDFPKNLKQKVGQIFSSKPFYNTTEGGKALKNEVIKLDQQAYRKVNKAYEKSRELNSNIEEIHPSLVQSLENTLSELKIIPAPSGPQKDLITSIEKILDSLAEYNARGEEGKAFVGYKPISNQTLLEQAKSLRQKIDYDFAHGNAKNIFKPTIGQLEEAALNAAKDSGNLQAAESLVEAKKLYKDWAETFDSDYVRPFRDVTNKDYSKLFKGALDIDEANVLKDILVKSSEGEELAKATSRELVEKHLGKFFDNPGSLATDEFNKALREIEALISPEESKAIKDAFKSATHKPITFKAKKVPSKLGKNFQKTAEYLDKEPEYIGEQLSSRSGIRKLKNELSKTEKGKQLFQENVKQKARSIMKEGKVHKSSTAKEFYDVLNQESNREIMAEIFGEEEINSVLDELAKKENQGKYLPAIKGLGKKYATLKFLKFIWPLL